MASRQSNSSSAEAKHLGPEASADEFARAVDRSLCERSSGIMTDFLCEPAMRMGGSASGTEDALADGVLIADGLDGRPLDGDHGVPARLVSPNQYGFVSTKHLCRIELHTAEPSENYHPSPIIDLGLHLLKPHPRARVWEEERHRHLPAWSVRRVYRLLIPVIAFLCSRGSRPLENHDVTGHQVHCDQ